MNIKELIESGSLELYVMGSLPPEETKEIDELRLAHKELNEEILKIEDAMIAYADTHAVKPKEELKEKIAGKLNFSVNLDLDQERVSSILIQMPGIYRFAAAASVALILTFAVTTFYYASKYHDASSQLVAMQSEKTQLANQVKFVTTESERIKGELAIASDPTKKMVALKGVNIAPNANAVVYWDKESGKTYLKIGAMPQITSDQQFQLWAMVKGKPVDLGVINKDGSTFIEMKDVQNAEAFAITLEPLGGKPVPDMDKLCVIGNV
ncbi:MAG: anti-sigma factor [Bacteroidota bacterium]|nr:anti-sigma factor [Bacteroidota bacterium]